MGLNHSPRLVTSGLILCLDAANSKSYPGSGTTWADLSGNLNDATITGSPTITTDGVTITGLTQYASLNFTTFSQYTTSYTLAIWFKLDTVPTSGTAQALISIGSDAGDQSILITNNYATYSGSRIIWVSYRNGQAQPDVFSSTTTHGTTNYVYVASVRDHSTPSLSGYLNGTLLGSTSFVSGAANYAGTNQAAYLGKRQSNTQPLLGKIANATIYNRALSAAEVAQNFNALRGRFGI